MATFAVLVEFELPDDGPGLNEAAGPLLDALRTLAPVAPKNVTVFANEAAEYIVRAGQTPHES